MDNTHFAMEKAIALIEIIRKNNHPRIRVKEKGAEYMPYWCDWLNSPVPGYVDFGQEPLPIRLVEFIEIDTVKFERIGKLIPDKRLNLKEGIIQDLMSVGIDHEILYDYIIRCRF